MLLRTKKLISSFISKKILLRNSFCHSNLISKLELQKQKADLSFEIYRLILKKPKGLDVEKKSLHDLIMEKIYQQSQSQDQNISHQQGSLGTKNSDEETFKYHEEARKPFIDLFQNGYKIDSKIYSQSRIQQGKIDNNGEQQKFIFHPTYSITNQVFKQLHTLRYKKRIMAGSQGISKTMSVCLFWHLAKFINEYRFQEGVTVSEDMMRVPKLVYWTLGTDYEITTNYIKEIILNQCPEVIKRLNLTEVQYDWRHSQIKAFYQKYFPQCSVNIVIDQFNFVAQLGRTHQKEIENIFKNRSQGKCVKTQNIQNEDIRLFFELKEKIEFCIHQFHGVLGLSSMNLANKLFEKQITFATSTNSLIPFTYWIQYSSKFYKHLSLVQIVDYFIFEMNQRIFKNLENTKVSQEDQKEMKKQCFDELIKRINKEQYFFFTPLDIAQKIIKLQDPQYFDKPIQSLKNEVKKIFYQFVKDYTKAYKKQLLDNFQKQDSQKDEKEKRIKLMFLIYNYLQQKLRNQTQQQNIAQVTTISFEILRLEPEEIEKFLDKKIFQCNKDDQVIKLMLPSRFMLKIIQTCVVKYLSMYAQFTLQQVKNTNNKSFIGQRFKSIFLKTLKKGNVKFQFTLKNLIQIHFDNFFTFQIDDGIYTFESLQKTSSNSISVSILDRFYQTIKQMRQKQKKYAVVFPVGKNCKKQQSTQKLTIENLSNQSKIIDFALIKNYLDTNLISIWLIDLTVSENQMQPKIQDFISQFLEFKDNKDTKIPVEQYKFNVEINYVVFGPKNDINHNDFTKTLKDKFGKQITFKTLQGSNAFTVEKLNDSESCLLKRIAYIDLRRDFEFHKQSKRNNKYIDFLVELFYKIQR